MTNSDSAKLAKASAKQYIDFISILKTNEGPRRDSGTFWQLGALYAFQKGQCMHCRRSGHASVAEPRILYKFATAIDPCIDCESACTCGDSFLFFYHRRPSSRTQMMASLVPRL